MVFKVQNDKNICNINKYKTVCIGTQVKITSGAFNANKPVNLMLVRLNKALTR